MGTIKDLVDLVTQLNSSVEDRKFASELRQVQSMIGAIQSEHAEIHEQRINLMTENAELRQNIASQKEEIVSLKQQLQDSKHQSVDLDNQPSEDEVQILVFLAGTKEARADQIAGSINQNPVKTEFYLNRLVDLDMIYFSAYVNQPPSYFLDQRGREYLVKNGLV